MDDAARARVALLRGLSSAGAEVFTTVLTRSPISRIDVARLTGLSQAAVTKAVTPLSAAGLVVDRPLTRPKGSLGRPANPVAIVADALVVIGMKVNADEVIAVVTDLQTQVVHSARAPLPTPSPDDVVTTVDALYDALAEQLGSHHGRLAGVGVSVSGDVDSAAGVVRESANMGWDQPVDLRALLSARLDVPIVLENDVRALAFSEHAFGVGLGSRSFAIVTIGVGIGSGLHVNGDVVEGFYGVAGEIGHLPLTSADHVCVCGRRGCVEAVAATAAIEARVSAGLGRTVTIEEAVALAHEDDPVAVEAFGEAARVIGTAIASLVNLVGPELVIIGGEAVQDFDLFDSHLREAFHEHAFGAAGRCRILVRPHSFEDWARGAAAAVVRSLT